MALTFGGATTDRVAITGHASFQDLTAFSVLLWCWPTSGGSSKVLWAVGATGEKRLAITAAPAVALSVNRVTTQLSCITSTVVSLTDWSCLAATWDGTTTGHIYIGTPSTPLVEASYSTNTLGTGAVTSEAGGAMNWGNRTGNNLAQPGPIARCQYFATALSLAELQMHQFRAILGHSCVVYLELGYAGTGLQPDWSGTGNAGTVTGATVSAHAPLGPLGWGVRRAPYRVVAPSGGHPWAHGGQDARFAPLIAQ